MAIADTKFDSARLSVVLPSHASTRVAANRGSREPGNYCLKRLTLALLALLTPAVLAHAAVEEPAKILDQPLPAFPGNAMDLEGTVTVEFSIDIDGAVHDAKVIEATPPGIFDAAALEAINRWHYSPKTIDGNPAEQTGTKIHLHFKPDPTTPALINQGFVEYPRAAFDAKLEGSVHLQFDVSQYGLVQNVQILASLPDSTFDQAAIKAVKDAVYKPAIIDGKPVATQGLTTTLNFNLADARFKPKRKPDSPIPRYPEEARLRGLEGYCRVHLTLRDDGTVEKSEIVSTYPARYFAPTCLEASQNQTYDPPGDDPSGRTAHFTEITYKFSMPEYYSHPTGDQRSKWAKFQYTIRATGGTANIELLESSPDAGSGWTGNAMRQLRDTRFTPHTENGTAVDWPNQIVIIHGPSN